MDNLIDYRAWNKITEEMKEYDPSYFGDIVFGMSGDDWIPMQNTGIKDKTGTYIYVGDIVEAEYGMDREVVPEMTSKEYHWFVYGILECGHPDLTILGNIYQNPELTPQE